MTNIVNPVFGKPPARFAGAAWRAANEQALGGIAAGFAVLSIRGKVFRVRVRGEEKPVLTPDGDPVASLSLVVLGANPRVSKTYYADGYEEGGAGTPTCFSNDGVAPDKGSLAPQAKTCAACRHNVWGSKITPSGSKVQACANSKRLAVVPAARFDAQTPFDPKVAESVLRNELFGGPMLLRLPGSALAEWARFVDTCSHHSVPYFAAVARLRFDPSTAYPRPVFEFSRFLTDFEAEIVEQLRAHPSVERIVGGDDAEIPLAAEPPVAVAEPPAVPEQMALPLDEPEWRYTPDGRMRWRPGMSAWEPVPTAAPSPPPPPPAAAAPPPPPPPPPPAPPARKAKLEPPPVEVVTDAELDQFLAEATAPTDQR